MYRTFILSVAFSLLHGCATADRQDASRHNFDQCLRGERACTPERLSAADRQAIEQRIAAAHLEDCMQRRRCNESILSDDERGRVRASVARLNHAACLRGEAECDARLLDELQAAEVAAQARLRNLEHCMGGLTSCDATRLTEAEAARAHEAYLARNFSGCLNTVGTLVACNPDDLSDAQRDAVRQRDAAVNYFLCASSAFGCDLSRLTPAQRQQIGNPGAALR